LFISASVDDFVDEGAPWFNLFQQAWNDSPQILQSKASDNRAFQQLSTGTSGLVRDQEAGGSNPLAPIFPFSQIRYFDSCHLLKREESSSTDFSNFSL